MFHFTIRGWIAGASNMRRERSMPWNFNASCSALRTHRRTELGSVPETMDVVKRRLLVNLIENGSISSPRLSELWTDAQLARCDFEEMEDRLASAETERLLQSDENAGEKLAAAWGGGVTGEQLTAVLAHLDGVDERASKSDGFRR